MTSAARTDHRHSGHPGADHEHVVHFYGDDAVHVEQIATHLAGALAGGGTGLLIATPRHRAAVGRRLRQLGFAVVALRQTGDLVELDASEVLARICPDGRFDGARFAEEIEPRVAAAGQPLHAYGEMVALLWADGHTDTALELEQAWDELIGRRQFSLLCGYPGDAFGAEQGAHVAAVGALHTEATRDASLRWSDRAPLELRFPLAPSMAAPRLARRATVGMIGPFTGDTTKTDAALIVSELVTNALLHGAEPVHLSLAFERDGVLRIAVSDGRPELGARQPASVSATTGRGLGLVANLARRWGVERSPDGKTVWAEVAADTGARPGTADTAHLAVGAPPGTAGARSDAAQDPGPASSMVMQVLYGVSSYSPNGGQGRKPADAYSARAGA